LQVADATARRLSSYRLEKQLVPNEQGGGRAVTVAEFASVGQQAEWVAAELEAGLARTKLAREEEGQPEPQSPLFAVLYRAHAHRGPLVAALQRRRIPFVIRNLAVNNLPPIRNLKAYLRAIGHPEDTVSLMRVLADPQWGLAVPQLIAHCRAARNRRVPLRAVIEEDEAGWPGRQRLLALLERYRKIAEENRLAAWLEALRRELALGGDAASDAALRTFSGFVEKWDQEKSQSGILAEFLEYFSYFEEAGGVVAFPEEGDDESAAGDAFLLSVLEGEPTPTRRFAAEQLSLLEELPKTAASQKVQLMTVHAAKGLEFEHVYLFHLLRNAFPVRNRKPLISLPDELWKGPLLAGDYHIEEERRLFYVALTRARSTLTLCTVSNDRQRPSPFLQELAEPPNPHLHWKKPAVVAPPSESGGAAESVPSARHSRIGEWASSLLPAPDGFSLSASGLETYLQCPLKYQFSYRWQIPLPPTPPMLFGSAMHAAVKETVAALARRKTHGTRSVPWLPAREELQAILNRHWPSSGFPDPLQERKYREEGLRQLEGACRAWAGEPFELLHQERRFEFEWGGTALNGRMDQINRTAAGDVELIEYKTGTPQTQKDANHSPQLTLYAEACRRVVGQAPGSLVLFNLATGERVRTARTPEQLQAFERLIRQTAAAMQAGRFPARPGFLCRYCDFRPICPAHEESDPGSTT
jgi:DNA helicase-2/ATP-dependent DNA helicase PcrA